MHDTARTPKNPLSRLKESSLANAASKEILIIDNHSTNVSKLHRAKSMSSTNQLNASNQQLYQKVRTRSTDSHHSSYSGLSTNPIRPNGKAENRTEAEGDIDLDEDIQESGERFLHVF
jgi:hypothetical protein